MASAGDKDGKTSAFWTTLPGILTGIAAVVTAITGLTLGLLQYGFFGSKQGEPGKPTTSATSTPAASTASQGASARGPGAPSASKPTETNPQRATVVITASDGTTTTSLQRIFARQPTTTPSFICEVDKPSHSTTSSRSTSSKSTPSMLTYGSFLPMTRCSARRLAPAAPSMGSAVKTRWGRSASRWID